jgi:putative ABC transport system substrate-binding protein
MPVNVGRRKLIAALGSAAAVWPLAAPAQRSAMPVVGFLSAPSAAPYMQYVAAIHQGLKEAGYVEGQNVRFEYRWADGHYDRLPALAADLVRRRVDVIAATGGPAALAAKASSVTIPIVFRIAADPIAAGLVASLSRPGGNVTGVTSLNLEVGPKRLEFLHELLPSATIMAALVNPTNPSNAEILSRDLQATARLVGLQLQVNRNVA